MKSAAFALSALASVNGLTDHVKNNVRHNFAGDRVVNIKSEHLTENLKSLLKGHDVDHFGVEEDGSVHMKISPDAVRALESASVNFEDTTENWINHFETNFQDPNFFCMEGTEQCAGRDMQAFYSSYQTLDAIYARIDSLAANSGGKATIGTLGTTYEGRNIKVIFVGDQTKPLVIYECNIHAREWLPPMYCTYMAETLLAGSGHPLLNTVSFAIVPSLNADGYVYSYTTNNMWRKTRKPNAGSSCIGTDPNRNWDDHHCGEGASTSPCSEIYCGHSPFDQKETALMRDFANAHADRLFSFADIHSYGGYWMGPLGWTYALPPAADYAKMLPCWQAAGDAVFATHGQRFTVGTSANAIYIAAGGSDDWFYSAHGILYSNSVELRGNSFQPAASNIMPSNEEIFAGMVAALECAIDFEFSATEPPADDCFDLNPNGITFSDGSPAPCSVIGVYCDVYSFVKERCPVTCGACDAADRVSSKDISEKVIQMKSSGPAPALVYVFATVASALMAGLAAAFVVVRRNKAEAVVEEAVVEAKPEEVAAVEAKKEEVVPVPQGKDAPKDMYDV